MRQGLGRLGLGIGMLLFVFWTCAYVIQPRSSEMTSWPPPFSLLTLLFLVFLVFFGATSVSVAPWVARGFYRR